MCIGKIDIDVFKNSRIVYFIAIVAIFLFSINARASSDGAIVGLLSTKYPTYEGEYRTASGIKELLLKLGAKGVVLVDYNVIMSELGYDASLGEIAGHLDEFLRKNNIDRIFIPGNKYNISSPPYPPVPYRQMVTDAVVNVMERRGDLKLLAICGGLQGVLHAQKVKVKRVQDILRSYEMAELHVSSTHDLREYGASLHRVFAVPGSKLAEIIRRVRGEKNGPLEFYVPDMHREAISTSSDNKNRLKELGYTISAVSDDGIVEGVEDSRGNMLLQMHPEYLLMGMEEKMGQHPEVDISIQIAKSIIENFLAH
ncbi:MAG: gamma-glutamyl-gamma-aminobutyrate hydrolase family protein [Aaplasma endosymbiont of Hyalomma asiaticum]